jgi:hypothetical protein
VLAFPGLATAIGIGLIVADPAEVTWKKEGCETIQKGVEDTECHCNHLTYFAVLVVSSNLYLEYLHGQSFE